MPASAAENCDEAECVVLWTDRTGKATKHAAKILRSGDKSELNDNMKELENGVDPQDIAIKPTKEQGRGCRKKKIAKHLASSEEELEPAVGKKKAKKSATTATSQKKSMEVILQKVRNRRQSDDEQSCTVDDINASFEAENAALKKENTNLKAALSALHMLPQIVERLEKIQQQSPLTSTTTVRPPRSVALTQQSTSATTVTSPGSVTPTHEDSNQQSTEADNRFVTAVANANRLNPNKFANDILHGLFSLQYMAEHSLAGGNKEKEALPATIVDKIIAAVQQTFPGTATVDIRAAIRQKLSNAVKTIKRSGSSKNSE